MKDFNRLFNEVLEKSNQKDYLLFHKKRFEHLYSVINKLKANKILDIGETGFTTILRKSGYGVATLNKKDADLEKDKIPFQDNYFNLVIYTEVIEHLRSNYLGSLIEINRILKPGGYMFFSTPNLKSLRKILFGENQIDRFVHYKEFSMGECIHLIKQANFKIIYHRFNPYLDFINKDLKFFLYYLIILIIPRFQESIEILAIKK